MDMEQERKLLDLLSQEHVAIMTTLGNGWPTVTMRAFAEPDLDLIFIMLESTPKFLNLQKRPNETVHIDKRDTSEVTSFQIIRAWIQGLAREVSKGSQEWGNGKAIFLKKNPFEEQFFKHDALRMVTVIPKRISYANGLGDNVYRGMLRLLLRGSGKERGGCPSPLRGRGGVLQRDTLDVFACNQPLSM